MKMIQVPYSPSKSDRELIEDIKTGKIQLMTREEHAELHGFKHEAKPRRRNKRPEIMPEPKGYYIHGDKYPDTVRISFEDGHTEIYDRRISQPSPVGYVNNSRRGKP